MQGESSINLLNSGAGASTGGTASSKAAAGHASLWHATAARGLVHLHHDGVHNSFQLLLLGLELVLLGELILVEPIEGVLDGLLNLVLVITLELVLQLLLLESVAHGEAVVLKAIFGFNLCLVLLILGAIFLSLLHHAVNLGL